MLPSHLLKSSLLRIFRAAIMNGITPSPVVVAQLEARGMNVGELETRLRQCPFENLEEYDLI
jgi:hypothetical protein